MRCNSPSTPSTVNTVVAPIYRPPGTKLFSFKKLLTFIQDYLDNSGNYDVYITGDLGGGGGTYFCQLPELAIFKI